MVSVIVPVYNTEKYLKRTVYSIINQTYTDWELILIDDGSTDNSPFICNEASFQNSKIYVHHQKNKGSAAARNAGIRLSKGEYLVFVDSDDEISTNFLESMVEKIEETRSDIVFCGLRRICGSNIVEQLYEDSIYSKDEYYIATYDQTKFKTRSCCTAIYKKDIIDKNSLFFPEELLCGEDAPFVLKYISYCNTDIITTNKCYYDYIYQNPASITKNTFFNHYIFEYGLYNESYKNSIDKVKFIEETGQRYIDLMIKELMCFTAYSNETLTNKIKQINRIVKDDLIQKALIHYKPEQEKHSRWIPRFMKAKMSVMTYLDLEYRVITTKYRKKQVKVKSIWKEQ